MSSLSTIDRAADSGPSARDYKAEIGELLAQADSLRAEADSIDLAAEAAASLGMATVHSTAAQQTADLNAARASEKINDQQERFKAGVVGAGGDLEREMVESSGPRPARGSDEASSNKYSTLMARRKAEQEQRG